MPPSRVHGAINRRRGREVGSKTVQLSFRDKSFAPPPERISHWPTSGTFTSTTPHSTTGREPVSFLPTTTKAMRCRRSSRQTTSFASKRLSSTKSATMPEAIILLSTTRRAAYSSIRSTVTVTLSKNRAIHIGGQVQHRPRELVAQGELRKCFDYIRVKQNAQHDGQNDTYASLTDEPVQRVGVIDGDRQDVLRLPRIPLYYRSAIQTQPVTRWLHRRHGSVLELVEQSRRGNVLLLSRLGRHASKKLAYSMPFGRNFAHHSKEIRLKIGYLLSRFDTIPIRERSGAAVCKRNFKVGDTQAFDPFFSATWILILSLRTSQKM